MNSPEPGERTIFVNPDGWSVSVLDQRRLPWRVEYIELRSADQAARAIGEMWIRGAPLIGVTAAYGLCLGLREDASDASLAASFAMLLATRPTAVNLRWALERVRAGVEPYRGTARIAESYRVASTIYDDELINNRDIGKHGLSLIRDAQEPGRVVNVLTHCNAGGLATVGLGTALAPIYVAHEAGIPVHVWVDETRPRNQGALLTAYELGRAGVAHTVITDNAGGHLMQRGAVDLCLVGADRVTREGDVCNKIGTYLKALAAYDNEIPFYVAFPCSTFDASIAKGRDVAIEERDPGEVMSIAGPTSLGGPELTTVLLTKSRAANPAFDITPARLITAYVTERGVCRTPADLESLGAP
jgi:methylthioribose-1-phosphate isomerase